MIAKALDWHDDGTAMCWHEDANYKIRDDGFRFVLFLQCRGTSTLGTFGTKTEAKQAAQLYEDEAVAQMLGDFALRAIIAHGPTFDCDRALCERILASRTTEPSDE